ncbi:MAG: amidase [Labedaea sp.]
MTTAQDLAGRIRRGEVSAVAVLEEHLDRIGKHNPELNAIVSLDADAAHRQAEAADAALRRGADVGPLHGVPMTLKDALDVAGLRTTVGTPVLDRVPDTDSTVAARLRAAGAIIIGHTNVPPWLADYRCENPIFGRTSNPWHLARTPGGSSGGAAAALAAGLTPLEVGSDLAGSIRLPAHFCGVYGLKTTEHRVPDTGFFRPPGGGPRPVRIMGSHGPMARSLDDLELALSIIAGPDGASADVAPVPLGSRPPLELGGLRLAVAPTLPGATVQRELREQVRRVAEAAAGAGARVDERLPEVDWAELNALFVALLRTITGVFDPAAELAAEQLGLAWYLTALDRRDAVIAVWEAFFAGLDALILPPAQTTAFGHDETGHDAEGALLAFANLTGLPSLVVPAGFADDGLPVGLQIVGPRWSELRLLAVAGALERAGILPGWHAPPGY